MSEPKHMTWDSWGAYMASMAHLPDTFTLWGEGDKGWQGVANLGEARALAANGWPAGMDKARGVALPALNAVSDLMADAACIAQDVTGAAFDVGAYLSGEPECWARPDAVESKRVVTIMANLSASAGIPADMLELRGGAVAALAMALQTAGHPVRVFTCMGCPVTEGWGGGDDASFSRVLLSDDSGGPLDMDRLVYGLAHPSALRALAFCATTMAAGKDPLATPHLAIPTDPPASLGWDCDLYLPAALVFDANWTDAASVEKWVLGQYQKLTGQVPGEGA